MLMLLKAAKEKAKEREESTERTGQSECKVFSFIIYYYTRKNVCKLQIIVLIRCFKSFVNFFSFFYY